MAQELVNISVYRRTANALEARAKAEGLSLVAYLQRLANGDVNGPPQTPDVRTAEAFDQLLDEFFSQNPRKLPALPPNFGRADIYSDHD